MSTRSKSNKRQKTADSPPTSDPEDPSSDDTYQQPLEPHSDGSSSPLRAPSAADNAAVSDTLDNRTVGASTSSERYTPERDLKRGDPGDTSKKFKELLKLSSPHGDRDTLTLRRNFTGGHQNARVLRRATPPDLFARVKSIGRIEGALKLDTHLNQMTLAFDFCSSVTSAGLTVGPVTPSNHIDYDNRIWAGAPFGELLTDKLARFFKALSTKQSIMEYISENDGPWTYAYLPLNPDPEAPVTVWRPVEDVNEESGYQYHLETLMEPREGYTFQSHIHPFFMLFNAAEKIHYWRQECTGIPARLTDAQKAICDTIEELTSDWFEDECDEAEDEMSIIQTESVTANETGDRRSVRIINANAKKRKEPDGGHGEE